MDAAPLLISFNIQTITVSAMGEWNRTLLDPVDGNAVLDAVLVAAAVALRIVAPHDILGACGRGIVEPRMELLVAGNTLLLVAALEAEIVPSVAIAILQDSKLRAGSIGVRAGADKADARRLERRWPINLRVCIVAMAVAAVAVPTAIAEEAGVVVDIAISCACVAQLLRIASIRREAA